NLPLRGESGPFFRARSTRAPDLPYATRAATPDPDRTALPMPAVRAASNHSCALRGTPSPAGSEYPRPFLAPYRDVRKPLVRPPARRADANPTSGGTGKHLRGPLQTAWPRDPEARKSAFPAGENPLKHHQRTLPAYCELPTKTPKYQIQLQEHK